MEWLIVIIMGVIAAAMIAYALLPNRADQEETVRRRTAGLRPDEDPNAIRAKAKQKAALPELLAKAAPLLSRPFVPRNSDEQSTLKAKLASAGFRRDSASAIFLASKSVGAVICGTIGLILGLNSDKEMLHIVGQTIFGLGLGFMLPNLWLSTTIRKRAESISNGLPDALDLMVVGVEAGLGLDAALLRVGDEMKNVHPNLSEEFQIATVETQMGVPRGEALNKMAIRSAVGEMRALVAVITQAEKLGTSIATALRTQSDALRTKRRQKAEERAQKTAVKLLLPLILFIFPSIFVVLAGPAAVHLIKTFGDR